MKLLKGRKEYKLLKPKSKSHEGVVIFGGMPGCPSSWPEQYRYNLYHLRFHYP